MPTFCAATLDDLLHESFIALEAVGTHVPTSRGETTELTAVVLELTNPRARLSRTEKKGTPVSALGEFCWYLSGRGDHASIRWYLPKAYRPEDIAADGTLPGAYGPRLIGAGQLARVIAMLQSRATTRQAVLQLFDANDLQSGQTDVPCTCTVQFLCREGRLHAVTYMRSNDAYRGFPHDVFCFTMLQEWIACQLGVELGTYTHMVGSFHMYTGDITGMRRYLAEGRQSTLSPMPPMPDHDPVSSLNLLLEAEAVLRAAPTDFVRVAQLEASVDGYWADLIRLLRAFRHRKDKDVPAIRAVREAMASPVYFPFFDRHIRLARSATT